ncbi:MAG: hypothetical protein HY253_06200 [Burkholderiales bacterium]|nr:hypothetical protein [Burkholderiales bacterium]
MKPHTANSDNKACQHLAIAHSKVGDVMICADCGVVHLALQTISMRFDMDAFSELARMLGRAQTAIESAQEKAKEKLREKTHNNAQEYFHHGNFESSHPRKVH